MIPDYASFVPGCTPTGPRSVSALTVDPLVACMIEILTKVFNVLRSVHLDLPSSAPPPASSSSSTSALKRLLRQGASPEALVGKELHPYFAQKTVSKPPSPAPPAGKDADKRELEAGKENVGNAKSGGGQKKKGSVAKIDGTCHNLSSLFLVSVQPASVSY